MGYLGGLKCNYMVLKSVKIKKLQLYLMQSLSLQRVHSSFLSRSYEFCARFFIYASQVMSTVISIEPFQSWSVSDISLSADGLQMIGEETFNL